MTDSITQLGGAGNMNGGDAESGGVDAGSKGGDADSDQGVDKSSQDEDCDVTETKQRPKSTENIKSGDAESGVGGAGTGGMDSGSGGGDANSDKRSQDEDCDVAETKQRPTSTENIKSGDADSGSGDADSGSGDADSGGGDVFSDQGVDKSSQDEDCDVTETKQRPKSTQKQHIERLNTQQPEDNVTNVHKQQKENTTEVGVQSHLDQEDLDTTDRKCIKVGNENYEVLHAGEDGSRLRTPKKKQNLAHLGKDDIQSHVETKRSPVAANTFIWHILAALLPAFLALLIVVWWFLNPSPSVEKESNLLEVFEQEIVKVQASFPRQHHELWRRSKIHVKKHLMLADPTEPVSVILTSGREAEKTLGCLAQRLATAFSHALNSTVLSIDGSSKSEHNSDDVKLEIDIALKEAFEGGTQAAVIHRFEELPPGSTLIFYRYCDHENSAFKKVFLAFTVMLQEEMAFPPNVSLGLVEEVVHEYLKEKFVSYDRTTKFNQVDIDKFSGLWSRISHLILPVTSEEKIEQHGCQT